MLTIVARTGSVRTSAAALHVTPGAPSTAQARRVHLVRRATTSGDDHRVAAVRAAISAMCATL